MKKRKIGFAGFLVLALVTGCFMSGGQAFAMAEEIETIPGEIILSIGENNSIQSMEENINEQLDNLLQDNDFILKDDLLESTEIKDGDEFHILGQDNLQDDVIENMGYTYLVGYPSEEYTFEEAKAKLEERLTNSGYEIKALEPNYVMTAFEATSGQNQNFDINPKQKWNYEMIQVPNAWTITTGGSNTRVAILDTGIDNTHPSLSSYVDTSLGKNFASGSSTDTMDRLGHGTHVAGTVASYGEVTGVMRTATLIPIKVLGDNGRGSIYGIQQGILYAAKQNVDVINMSLGGGRYSSTFNSACKTAVQNGTVVVAASGNESASSISYPSAYDSVIAVGAVDSNGERGYFSNYGTGLDFMAPGVDIYSTYLTNDGSYDYLTGTSMACPHVAGVVGLLKSVDKDITAEEVRGLLKETAKPAGSSKEYGAGIVNAYKALQKLTGIEVNGSDNTTAFNAEKWIPEQHYQLGSVVSYDGNIYVCIKAHMSQKDSNPANAAALWFLCEETEETAA